jgi:hypothetical protein
MSDILNSHIPTGDLAKKWQEHKAQDKVGTMNNKYLVKKYIVHDKKYFSI